MRFHTFQVEITRFTTKKDINFYNLHIIFSFLVHVHVGIYSLFLYFMILISEK